MFVTMPSAFGLYNSYYEFNIIPEQRLEEEVSSNKLRMYTF